MTKLILSLCSVLTLVVLGTGCGGDDSNKDTAGGQSAGAIGETTSFKSSLGYTIERPTKWEATGDIAAAPGIKADFFTAPEAIDGFTPNVNILCDPAGAGSKTDAYLKANLDVFKTQKITGEQKGNIKTGAGDAALIYYTTAFGGRTLDFAQVYLADSKCGWVMTLTTPENKREQFLGTLRAMAASFTTR